MARIELRGLAQAFVRLAAISLAFVACSSSQPAQSASDVSSERAQAVARLGDAADMLSRARAEIPDALAARARCVVVVPALVKGALIVGAESGHGFADCRTSMGFSPPAPITIRKGSVGAQIGFESAELLALLTSDSAMQALSAGNFTLGTDASAAAGPVTKDRSGPSDLETKAEVLSYSRSRSGLFAGVQLSGSNIISDEDAIRALYGAPVTLRAILENRVPMPDEPEARHLVAALTKDFPPTPTALR